VAIIAKQGMPIMTAFFSTARDTATLVAAALVTSLLFVSAAVGPLPVA
jgi:hypothetical protein